MGGPISWERQTRKQERSFTVTSSRPGTGHDPKVLNRRTNGKHLRSRAGCRQIFQLILGMCIAIEAGTILAIGWAKVIAILRIGSGETSKRLEIMSEHKACGTERN